MHAGLLAESPQLAFFLVPREWCCPQWAGSSHTNWQPRQLLTAMCVGYLTELDNSPLRLPKWFWAVASWPLKLIRTGLSESLTQWLRAHAALRTRVWFLVATLCGSHHLQSHFQGNLTPFSGLCGVPHTHGVYTDTHYSVQMGGISHLNHQTNQLNYLCHILDAVPCWDSFSK